MLRASSGLSKTLLLEYQGIGNVGKTSLPHGVFVDDYCIKPTRYNRRIYSTFSQ